MHRLVEHIPWIHAQKPFRERFKSLSLLSAIRSLHGPVCELLISVEQILSVQVVDVGVQEAIINLSTEVLLVNNNVLRSVRC